RSRPARWAAASGLQTVTSFARSPLARAPGAAYAWIGGRKHVGSISRSRSMNGTRTLRPRQAPQTILRWLAASVLMVGAAALVAPPAQASQTVLGAIVGGGAGAMIGQSFGGRDGAVIGGAIGAAAGAAAAQHTRHGGYGAHVGVNIGYPPPVYVPAPPVVYAPAPVYHVPPAVVYRPPVVVYKAPRVVHAKPPRVVYRSSHGWSGDRHHHHHGHRGGHGRGHRR